MKSPMSFILDCRKRSRYFMWFYYKYLVLCLVSLCHLPTYNASPLSSGVWGPTNPVACTESTIVVAGVNNSWVRFTILTPRMIRIERSTINKTSFEDRKTLAVINRNLPSVPFQHHQSDNGVLTITTSCLTVTYQIGKAFTKDTLQVTGKMYCNTKDDENQNENLFTRSHHQSPQTSTNKNWTYRYGMDDPLNLLGTIRTLDGIDDVSLNCSREHDNNYDHCEWGLISRSGFAILNNTLDYTLDDDNDWWDGPNQDAEDLYLMGHGHDYPAALQDYRKIGGFIPLLPRYALGVWFSRWHDYTTASANAIVQQYEELSLPLDVFVFDLNWHKKNDWTGVSWDRHLHPNPQDATAYFKYRGIAVTLSLHDADGVNPWEDRYEDLCQAVGCSEGDRIKFSIVNQTMVYAMEDVVLQPLERQNGVDFWWIDWQQGESGCGGAAGGKQNPTIWLAHVRSTNVFRRRQSSDQVVNRSMTFGRWGGLGAHRYPIQFSGDVKHMSWENLAYQTYFSMTAVNVGAIWTHDVEAPSQDPELFTRWVQWGVVSGIIRTHDRGLGSGRCAATTPYSCSIMKPWDAPPQYAHANYDALRLRGCLMPYIYTMAYRAYQTGLWFPTPFYYEWPELEGAYETSGYRPDPGAKYDPQYLFGTDIWVAPVVKPANETDELTRLTVWIPPGTWVGLEGGQVLRGELDGATSVDLIANLDEIPMFVRAGAIIPSIRVRPGATIALAMRQFDDLIWTIYLANGAPTVGTGIVYEDDGLTTEYCDKNQSAITKALYNITTSSTTHKKMTKDDRRLQIEKSITTTLAFSVSTHGHFNQLPGMRSTTLRIVNCLPPTSIYYQGTQPIPFSRFGGMGSWSYDSQNSAIVIELPAADVKDGVRVNVAVETTDPAPVSTVDGLGFKLRRAKAAKASLDSLRLTPGSQTGQDKMPGFIMKAVSSQSAFNYLAGHSGFVGLLLNYTNYLNGAVEEARNLLVDLQWMQKTHDTETESSKLNAGNATTVLNRVAKALVLLESA